MLNFRPHRIQLITTVQSGGTDEDGVPIPDTESVEEMRCNIIPNGRGEVVYLDGIAMNYSYHIYLDRDCPDFKKGDKVRLFGADKVRLFGADGKEIKSDKGYTVKQFFRYQLNAQVWV